MERAIADLNNLTERQQKTYEMLREGDRSAAQNYYKFCTTGQVQPGGECKSNEPYKICMQCQKKFYRHLKCAVVEFNKRKFCSRKCFAEYRKKIE